MTDEAAVRRLFDSLADEYDEHVPFFRAFGRALVHWCAPTPGDRVLDVAAGRGAITVPAAESVGPNGAVVAIDTAPNMLRSLAADVRELPQVSTRLIDAHELDFPDASFDTVLCGFTLHFLDDPTRVLAEVHRVLRPGGRLAFSTPPGEGIQPAFHDHRWDFRDELIREMAGRSDVAKRPDRFTPPPRPLRQMCAEVGFVEIEQRGEHASFPLRDPRHYWDWQMSHGFRGYVEDLGPRLAEELRRRLFDGLAPIHAAGDLRLDATVGFHRMRRPAYTAD